MPTEEPLELPRGIRLLHESARKLPFAVQWRVDGKRVTRFWKTEVQRDRFAKGLAGDVAQLGVAAYRLNEDEAREWRAFRADLGNDVPLADVLRCWRKHGSVQSVIMLEDAIAAFLKAKESEGMSKPTLGHYKPILGRLLATVGNIAARSVAREQLEAYVSGLTEGDAPAANESKRSHYKRARSLFRWLKDTRQIPDNPCDGMRGPKEIVAPISVMSVADGRSLFAKNEGEPRALLGRLALEAFGGMRHGAASLLPAGAIDFKHRTITIPANIDKNGKEQYIEHLPDNLWAWLKWSKPETWKLSGVPYRNAKGQAFIRAGVTNPGNVLRHSFPSYHIALHGDAGKTATILTHANLGLLWKRYRGKGGGVANGKAWFTIIPPKR